MIAVPIAARPPSPPATDQFNVFGYRFGLAARSAVARRLIGRLYTPFTHAGSDPPAALFHLSTRGTGRRRVWQVRLGEEQLVERPSLKSVLQHLEYEICLRVIEHRLDLIVLHGATVFARDGAAFITGASGAGKSTLALALAARGYRVGGDDAAFLDPSTGEVRPLPRCAHLDLRSRVLLRRAGLRVRDLAARHGFITPADLGAAAPVAAPVRHVLLASRGAAPWPHLAPLAQAEMAVRLLHEAGWAAPATGETVAAIGRLVGGAACYRLVSGRLDATVEAVAALLGPA